MLSNFGACELHSLSIRTDKQKSLKTERIELGESGMSANVSPPRPSEPPRQSGGDQHRIKFLVNSELLSDVSFLVGSKGTLIYGHRFPLAAGSDVFYRMFTSEKEGGGSRVGGPIVVSDVEADTFLEMLKYVYYDNPTLSEDNLVELYYAAAKYNLMGLKDRCRKFVAVEEGSVMKVFQANVRHGFEELNDACLRTISRNPLVMFRSSDFLELPLELVERIAGGSKLRCNDDQLMDALRKWCKHQPELQTEHFKKLTELVKRQREQTRDYQCRKWLFFGPICYTIDPCKGTFHVTALKEVIELYGVGIYVGCHENDQPMSISVALMDDGGKMIRRCQANVPPREDIYVYDCMFERVSLWMGTRLTVVCDGPRRQGETPLKKFTFWNRGFTWTGDSTVLKIEDDRNYEHTAIAYVLYQVKE